MGIGTISAAMLQSRFYKNFVCVLPQYFLGILAESASACTLIRTQVWSYRYHTGHTLDIHWTYIGYTLDIHYHSHPVVNPILNKKVFSVVWWRFWCRRSRTDWAHSYCKFFVSRCFSRAAALKNSMFSSGEFGCQGAVSGFSGQKLYNDILYQFYNVIWTQSALAEC